MYGSSTATPVMAKPGTRNVVGIGDFAGPSRVPRSLRPQDSCEKLPAVPFRDASAADLEPIAIGWLADLLAQLETALATRTPNELERSFLLSSLPRLKDAISDWVHLLETQASGEDVADSVWSVMRKLTGTVPAELALGGREPDAASVMPRVARDSVAGQILFARMSRAMEPDAFRDAAAALESAGPDELARLVRAGQANAERATRSIDACLGTLAVESA
jgi:hypothetical protein